MSVERDFFYFLDPLPSYTVYKCVSEFKGFKISVTVPTIFLKILENEEETI